MGYRTVFALFILAVSFSIYGMVLINRESVFYLLFCRVNKNS